MGAAKAPRQTDLYVGKRLKARRLEMGMSQTDIGAAVDLTFQQVQKYEKGSNRVSASRLQQFAVILKVPVSYFFEGLPGNGSAVGGRMPKVTTDYTTFLGEYDGHKFMEAVMAMSVDERRIYLLLGRSITKHREA